MFLRNVWYAAGWAKDLPAKPTGRTLLGERVVFYRTAEGRLVGMEDRCPHRLAPLSHGRCEGDNIRCMYHGLLFAPDGQCVLIPGQDTIPAAVQVRTYPVEERHGLAWIWMGDADLADPELVPPFQGPVHPDWAMIPGHMEYEAHHQLINDNLLDLSHLDWVHIASFGGNDPAVVGTFSNMPMKITALERGVRVSRWAVDAPMPPFVQATTGVARGDMLSSYDFLVPGIFLLSTTYYAPGAAAGAEDGVLPGTAPLHRDFSCQAVTPITERQSIYYFGFGPQADRKELAQGYCDMAVMAFTEDKVMIEAQQKVIDNDPSRRMLPLNMDGAPLRYNALVAKMMKAEALRREVPEKPAEAKLAAHA